MLFITAVGEIQARDVHPSLDQLANDFSRTAGGSDGGNNLRAAHDVVKADAVNELQSQSAMTEPLRFNTRHRRLIRQKVDEGIAALRVANYARYGNRLSYRHGSRHDEAAPQSCVLTNQLIVALKCCSSKLREQVIEALHHRWMR